MKFVDRTEELQSLRRVLAGARPALVRLYGRRRLGKTEILRKLCREQQGLYILVEESDSAGQLQSLGAQVAEQTGVNNPEYLDWDDFLRRLPNVGRRFVVLDEFQRLLMSDPAAVSRLQHRWDTLLKDEGPSVVLSGSSVGMMQRLTQKGAAPLFGRLAADLRLRPLPYAAVRLLYPRLEESERIRRYAVFGGTPFYHQFCVGRPLKEAVFTAFLDPTAPLVDEPQNLLRLELQSPARYNAIMHAIGRGTHDLPGLESKAGVEHGGLAPYLETLRNEMDLIKMEDPVCGVGKRARYVFGDPFFSFYYRFIFEARPQLELGRAGTVWKRIGRELTHHESHHFEEVAREGLRLLNGKSWGGVRIDFSQIGRWWNRQGEEIDIVAAGPAEVIVGEVKWTKEPAGPEVLRRLMAKTAFMERLDNRPTRPLLVSRNGFTPGARQEAGRTGALLLDLHAITEIFERSRP